MPNLYDRLAQIIGKPSDDPLVTALKDDLGREHVLRQGKRSAAISYPDVGLTFTIVDGVLTGVFFHFGSAAAQAGTMTKYAGDLPAGIKFGDHRAAVAAKLGMQPSSSKQIRTGNPDQPKDYWEHYDFGHFEATFIFDGVNELLGSMALNSIHDHATPDSPICPEVDDDNFFDDFSHQAMTAIQFARDEARRFSHKFIGSEQLLLGFLAQPDSIAARALATHGITSAKTAFETYEIIGHGSAAAGDQILFSPRARCVLSTAKVEAEKLGSPIVYPHHMLLAMLEDGEGVGPRVLENLGADLESLRRTILSLASADS